MAAPSPSPLFRAEEIPDGESTVMIQIRNVPDSIHRQLKSKAALEGMTLSDYLLREVRGLAQRPTPTELRARILSRERVSTPVPVSDLIRAERGE